MERDRLDQLFDFELFDEEEADAYELIKGVVEEFKMLPLSAADHRSLARKTQRYLIDKLNQIKHLLLIDLRQITINADLLSSGAKILADQDAVSTARERMKSLKKAYEELDEFFGEGSIFTIASPSVTEQWERGILVRMRGGEVGTRVGAKEILSQIHKFTTHLTKMRNNLEKLKKKIYSRRRRKERRDMSRERERRERSRSRQRREEEAAQRRNIGRREWIEMEEDL